MDSTNLLRLTDETEDPIVVLLNVLRSVPPTARLAFTRVVQRSLLSRFLNPRLRVTETEEAFLVKTEVPGIPLARVRVTLDRNGLLQIGLPEPRRSRRAPRGLPKPGKQRPAAAERVRIVPLGPGIVRERAAAAVEEGVLTVFIPKKKPVSVGVETSDVRAA